MKLFRKSYDLSPNPNLPPLERQLQSQLLKLIESFGTFASQLDSIGMLDKYNEMWSTAHYEAFRQTIQFYAQWE